MTAPHTGPSEEQVRERRDPILATHEQRASLYRAALALLDAGRKDREALVIADEWFGGCDCITTETGTDERKRSYWALRRAALDQARGK